jgi:hypothetical protein
MTEDEVRDFQRTLNTFTTRYLAGVQPLRVDGEAGFLTNRRARTAMWYTGYDGERIRRLGASYRVNKALRRELVRRVRHPRDSQYFPSKFVMYRGIRRRAAQKARHLANQTQAYLNPGVTTWGGKTVANCAVAYLNYAKAHGWQGGVNSGWRAPWYSEQLCYQMCGAPRCPGKCAGTASNHVGNTCDRFAIDVSDYTTVGRLMASMPNPPHGRRIFNALGARDPVHFSPSGN